MRRTNKTLAAYFLSLTVAYHEAIALIGFTIFLIMYVQIVSGVMLALSLIAESMNIPLSREEEDAENLYIDDWFFIHERGVDWLMIFMFLHFFRKMYLNVADIEQEAAWKSGVLVFLLVQITTFLGLVLCCTHLSDITLTIATNAFQTFFAFIGKLYWLIFTDQTLNSDTIIRMSLAHYFMGCFTGFCSIYHGVDMHADWKVEATLDGIRNELSWYDEAFANEVGKCMDSLQILAVCCLFLYTSPEALSYEIFMWGDVGMQVDVRFYGVAPHWYFRPYMAWLITCPYHYTGIFGLVAFFVCFYYQPNIISRTPLAPYGKVKAAFMGVVFRMEDGFKKLTGIKKIHPESDLFFKVTYTLFLTAMWYAFSYLPYGRFFNRLGGNTSNVICYGYLFIYLGTSYLRVPHMFILYKRGAL